MNKEIAIKREIMFIQINPHYCTREEYKELLDYLSNNCWDYKKLKNRNNGII